MNGREAWEAAQPETVGKVGIRISYGARGVLDEAVNVRVTQSDRQAPRVQDFAVDALPGVEHRGLGGVRRDGDHHLVEQDGGAAHHVEVTEVEGIEGPGADGEAHGSNLGAGSAGGEGSANQSVVSP